MPVIVGTPCGRSFTAVTSIVIVYQAALSCVPSLTVNVNDVYGSPWAFGAGVNVRCPASRSALVTSWFRVTALPLSSSCPACGSATILTPASVAPGSVSEKLKSPAANVWGVSSSVVTLLSLAVGADVPIGTLRESLRVVSDDQSRPAEVHE